MSASLSSTARGRGARGAGARGAGPPRLTSGSFAILAIRWGREIAEKVSPSLGLSVYTHHGADRAKTAELLCNFDVVLTTYAIVGQEAGVKGKDKGKVKAKEKAKAPLGNVHWFRVVLDEAQTIKNAKTLSAQSCWKLWAERRWCLSGTPIQNSVEDLFSYFSFLKYGAYGNYHDFCRLIRDEIASNPEGGYKRLQAVLDPVMLRRTKQSKIEGQPIIELPPREQKPTQVAFNAQERALYKKLDDDSKAFLQRQKKSGVHNYVNMLCLLLKLRQACNHPWLVKGYGPRQDPPTAAQVAAVGRLREEDRARMLFAVQEGRAECPLCSDVVNNPVISKCNHMFCRECVDQAMQKEEGAKLPCPCCQQELSAGEVFSEAALKSKHQGGKGQQNGGGPDAFQPSAKIRQVMTHLKALHARNKPHRPAPKAPKQAKRGSDGRMAAALRPLPPPPPNPHMMRKVETEKVVIFTQWTSMLDILEIPLRKEGYKFRRLDGSMSIPVREKAVNDFLDDPTVTVMIMSLKAASLGLNLVVANHVILLDLWWNPTVEEQAIDRCHRIGQTRTVTVTRITVKDSVEDRILKLQEKKRALVKAAFGESKFMGKAARLTRQDLEFLFNGAGPRGA